VPLKTVLKIVFFNQSSNYFMKISLLVAVSFFLFLSSCEKDSSIPPYSVFQSTDYQTLEQDNLSVDLNSSYSMVIKVGYDSTPTYFL
jgi:YbbR domain-containing protein